MKTLRKEAKLAIPLHNELDMGTLRTIFGQAVRYIPEEKLKSYFYD